MTQQELELFVKEHEYNFVFISDSRNHGWGGYEIPNFTPKTAKEKEIYEEVIRRFNENYSHAAACSIF